MGSMDASGTGETTGTPAARLQGMYSGAGNGSEAVKAEEQVSDKGDRDNNRGWRHGKSNKLPRRIGPGRDGDRSIHE